MHCSQCGEQIDDGSRFCRYCGAPQQQETAPVSEPMPNQVPALKRGTPTPVAAKDFSVGKVIGILLAVAVGIAVLGSWASKTNPQAPSNSISATSMEADDADLNSATTNVAATTETSSPWSYSTDEDKVRGKTTYFASTTSTNTIHQDAPYDSDTSMTMTVRQSPSSGSDVVLSISSGQMMCPSYEGCSGTVRFDDGPAQRVEFNGPADDSSETIFVKGARSFIAKLKKAKHVVVEKTLYQAGEPQFEFDVHGLKWDH